MNVGHVVKVTAWMLLVAGVGLCAADTQADSISQYGITWRFDRDYTAGQFANGDYWVLGPVSIIEIEPHSVVLPSNNWDRAADIWPRGGDQRIDMLDWAVVSSAWLSGRSFDTLYPGPDCRVDVADLAALLEAWLSSEASANWNALWDVSPMGGDGYIDFRDLSVLADVWREGSPPGLKEADFNGDCTVDLVDVNMVVAAWLSEPQSPHWSDLLDIGPATGDGFVDFRDFALLIAEAPNIGAGGLSSDGSIDVNDLDSWVNGWLGAQSWRTVNGSMVNPSPALGTRHGFDSATPDLLYDATINVALNVSMAEPLVLEPDSSLVSCISIADESSSNLKLQTAAILTVVDAPAPEGSLRPPYCGTDKTVRFNKSQINYALLENLPVTSEIHDLFPGPIYPHSSILEYLAEAETYFERPWIDYIVGWSGQYIHPQDNMPGYGNYIADQVSASAVLMHLDFPNEQKEKLVIGLIQVGIDLYGIVESGGFWPPDGGHASARKWPILFAGLMLSDSNMANIGQRSGDHLYDDGHGCGNPPADFIHFGEDSQTFYVTQADVDLPRNGSKEPYLHAHIGMPEWGIRHATARISDSSAWDARYRGMHNVITWGGFVLAAHIMEQNASAKTAWNHDALFDYVDRQAEMDGLDTRHLVPTVWQTYRPTYGSVWAADPCAPDVIPALPPRELTTTGYTASSISLSWTAPGKASDGDLPSAYRIFRDSTFVEQLTETFYEDTGLDIGRSYHYEVYSLDDADNVSHTAAAEAFCIGVCGG